MKKILIIEDDPVVAHIYRSRLEKEGYNVEAAEDGQTGFYRIHEFHPDGVLLDLMLPKMNGVEILKKIRAQSQFAHTPILVFTNAYVPNMIQEAQSAGASHVFNKATITPRQILDTLQLLLSSQAPAPQSGPTLLRPPAPESNKPSAGRGDPLFSNPATPATLNHPDAVRECSLSPLILPGSCGRHRALLPPAGGGAGGSRSLVLTPPPAATPASGSAIG